MNPPGFFLSSDKIGINPISSEPEARSIHAALAAGLESGTLRPVIGMEIPLSDAAQAHRKIMEPGAFGKIVLIP